MDKYQDDIERYLNNRMTNAERYSFEKRMLNDAFLAEAIEGAQNTITFGDEVDDLVKSVDAKTEKKQEGIWWRIAAGLALLAISTFVVWQYTSLDNLTKQQIATRETKNEAPTEADSIQEKPKKLIAENSVQEKKVYKQLIVGEEKATRIPTENTVDKSSINQPDEIAEPELVIETMAVPEVEKSEIPATPILQESTSPIKEEIQTKIQDEISKDKKSIRSSLASTAKRVIGKVKSANDDSFLQGINVVEMGTTNGTLTKKDGSYELILITENPTLIFSFIGMQTQQISVEERSVVDAELTVDVSHLSEVVVTGYGGKTTEENNSYEKAKPIIGLSAYNRYLDKAIVYPVEAKKIKKEGLVTITFQVNPDGTLSDFEIVRTAGFGMDDALLKAIKEGPTWQSAKINGTTTKGKATVKYRFKL